MNLELLLDSAEPTKWEGLISSGIFNGITTNPTLLKKAKQPCNLENLKRLSLKAERMGWKELHLQAWGDSSLELEDCGISLSKFATESLKIHVKLPITKIGHDAAQKLIKSNVSVTLTACYEQHQTILAASIGASYIAPYLGRINDNGKDGIEEILSMNKILKNLNSECKLLVASIRKIEDINSLIKGGINTFTISPELAEKFFENQFTLEASTQFSKDSKASNQKTTL